MLYNQIVNFLSFAFFILLMIEMFRVSLFWLYLWQRKEYRWDRLKAHFSLREEKRKLLAILLPFSFSLWRKPKINLRLFLTSALLLIISFRVYFLILKILAELVRHWPIMLFPVFPISLLLLFCLTPLIVALVEGVVAVLLEPMHLLFIFLAKRKLARTKPLVIAITGSYAKTATKEILRQVLKMKYKVLATTGSVNTPLGIAKEILERLKKEHQIFIVEMGAYKKGEINYLCQIVRPTVGIITGINSQHQQLFGKKENIIKAKFELIKALRKDGLAIFNGDNPISAALAKKTTWVRKKIYFYPERSYETSLLGRFQQLNIEAALAVTDHLGLNRQKVLKRIKILKPFSLMLRLRKGVRNSQIIDNSHNSNPDGFWEALQVLKDQPQAKKIVITSGIIELGNASRTVHKRLGKRIGEVADRLILTSDNFLPAIASGTGKAFLKKIEVISTQRELEQRLGKLLDKNIVVLLEGWNGEAKRILFSKKRTR